ncbi:MAG: patatin-like phospholipase family protein [Dehalococcoidia bacterium]|nr:MAG: patatin-like phospholipase family protein [Dehalococcoidia bacterium]
MNDYSRPGTDTPERKKVAFVLSGAGNQGALEVGVLLSLFEHNIRPDILVGTSVGAINAAAIAINPTLEGAQWLETLWRGVTKEDIMPNSYLSMVWRLVRGHSSVFDNENLRAFLESQLPEGIRQFGDIKETELYITAVDLHTGDLRVFGINRTESLVDAVMASTALPPFLSPWQYQGREYVDGGVISDLPIRVALEMNATETYAIGVYQRQRARKSLRGIFRVISQIVSIVSYQRLLDELGWCSTLAKGGIHYIGVDAFEGLRFWDFSHTEEMLEKGKQVGERYLREHGLA